ncbi:hypothetical protein CBR_g29332 [Chara braunii]|uniref:Uncharacterized protein n=1 Tax=Chara braunii TaxID=69332 RepID=A0A388JWM4_CHABU|nr:hypothetical protein CBR_g29332 [Chara braunii]|eukprot:GBG62132.1 hypothetical protein CBR_g29332 [Chara braunii]
MLEEGIGGGEMEIVDLDFGLSSGTAAAGVSAGQMSVHGVGGVGPGGRSYPQNGSAGGCHPAPSFPRGAGSSSEHGEDNGAPSFSNAFAYTTAKGGRTGGEHKQHRSRRKWQASVGVLSATDAPTGRGEHNERVVEDACGKRRQCRRLLEGSAIVQGITNTGGERQEEGRHEEAGRKDERREQTPRSDDDDDESLSSRKKKTRQKEELEAKSKLWTDRVRFNYTAGMGEADFATKMESMGIKPFDGEGKEEDGGDGDGGS